jgi:response regulator RpfG family c-di-GMP phosphodiesterase
VRLRKLLLLVVFASLLCISCPSHSQQTQRPVALKGIIDLTQWNFNNSTTAFLNGEWECYPSKLLQPEDFTLTTLETEPVYVQVPAVWEDLKKNGVLIDNIGFATYRLRILLPDTIQEIAIKPGAILTAYKMYINGHLLSERGVVSEKDSESKPLLLTDTIQFQASSNTIEVLLQISNYHHRLGGPWEKIEIGSIRQIEKNDSFKRDSDFMILGALLVMGFFYLSMFLLRKKEHSYLYFSLFCLSIALRMSLQSGVGYIYKILPFLEWEIVNKLEYLTMYLALPFFMLFTLSFFKDKILLMLFRIVGILSLISTAITFSTFSIIHSRIIPFYQVVVLLSGLYLVFVILVRTIKKDRFARILLVGTVVLFATVVNDILFSNSIINSIFLLSYGLLFFIFLQAYVLTIRLLDVFSSVERQKKQLQKTNAEYRKEIESRIRTEAELLSLNENLVLARSAIILGLAKIAEYRDSDTGEHLSRIKEFNRILAIQLSEQPQYADYITIEYINDLCESSILHDIGKVGISDAILLKPGKLTDEEFEMIKKHPIIGGDTIKSIEKNIHAQTFLTLGREIAYMHHEKWDGSGYPRGLAGENISLSARITAVSDVYDALTTKRCYKDAFSHEMACKIIEEGRGTHFDPSIVDAFIAVKSEFERLNSTIV